MGCVYKHTSPSNHAYIGKTVNTLEDRWDQHVGDALRGSDLAIHNAIRKHGADSFGQYRQGLCGKPIKLGRYRKQ